MNTLTQRYAVSANTVEYCEAHGLLHEDENYTDDEIRRFGLIHTLLEADFPDPVLTRYLTLVDTAGWGNLERKRLLRQQRSALLDTIRQKEKALSQLDYMLYELESHESK